MYLLLCHHFDINMVLLFKRLFWLACAIVYSSLRQRSNLHVPHLYGAAYTAILHFRFNLIPLHCNCQTFWEFSFVFIILIPNQICVIVVPILELSIRYVIIYVCFILHDNISSLNNARFQATASKWKIAFISAIAWTFFAIS